MELEPDEVAAAFGRPVASYDVEPIDPHLRIHAVTGGVFRVRAGADTLVLKVVRHGEGATPEGLWVAGAQESHRNYWKREWLAFDCGLLDALPGELRAPARVLTTEAGERECRIWMADVRGRTGAELQLEDIAAIAHALGTTQGAYAGGAVPLPQQPWLSRDWLRGWVEICGQFVAPLDDAAAWRDERLAALRPLRPRIRQLWAAREELLAVALAAPPTVTHWDFWPANVFRADDGTAVAIDWSQIGIGTLTADLDQLTLDTVWMLVRPDESLDALEAHVLPPYLAGLRAGGVDVDEAELRRWYAAAAALRYAWLGGGQPANLADAAAEARLERRFGRDAATVVAAKARVVERAVALGEEALG